MANKHINKNKTEEQILKQGFKAGVTMACLSMGKFEKDEDTPKLDQFANKLYSEFLNVIKHNKEAGDGAVSDTAANPEETTEN